MAIKCVVTCRNCTYGVGNSDCAYHSCDECPNGLEKPIRDEKFGMVSCRCITVREGEECKYYKEATEDGTDN